MRKLANIRSNKVIPSDPMPPVPLDPESAAAKEEKVLKILRFRTELLQPEQENAAYAEVAINRTGMRCLADHPVSVETRDAEGRKVQKRLHANKVTLQSWKAQTFPTHTHLAGQSPDEWKDSQSFLLKAIESGQGLFQFVSAQQQANENRRGHAVPIIKQLRDLYAAAEESGNALIIGGRYRVTNVLTAPHAAEDSPTDHSRYALSVINIEDATDERTIFITQAGLPFTDGVLDVTQIQRASELFNRHRELSGGDQGTDAPNDQMFVSTAGFGRNATLMTYQDVSQRIDSKEISSELELDHTLHVAIIAGRKARGYRFVQSEEQVKMLRRALVAKFAAVKERELEQVEEGELARATPVQQPPQQP